MPAPKRRVPPRPAKPTNRPRPAWMTEAERPRPSLVRIETGALDARTDLAIGDKVLVTAGRFAGEEVEIVELKRSIIGLPVAQVRSADGAVRTQRSADLGPLPQR